MLNESNIHLTALHQFHKKHGGKMIEFAGYSMPVNYADGIIKEHQHCRNSAALFDVSHMGQIMVTGREIASKLEQILPIDLIGLPVGRQKYALFLNEHGKVLDDLMVINNEDYYILVVNASRKDEDFEHLHEKLDGELNFELLEQALIALQGPKSAHVLSQLNSEINQMRFMDVRHIDLNGISALVARSGYTGEDGFEISVDEDQVEALCERLLQFDEVKLAGLGARDSLRMEAGLPLYGHELTLETTPVEANLRWAISPARRTNGKRAGNFTGASTILNQLDQGVDRLLVGLSPEGRAPIRDGALLFDATGNEIGVVTSGAFSPSLGRPIAIGSVKNEFAVEGSELFAEVRNKRLPLRVTKLPFVPHNYLR